MTVKGCWDVRTITLVCGSKRDLFCVRELRHYFGKVCGVELKMCPAAEPRRLPTHSLVLASRVPVRRPVRRSLDEDGTPLVRELLGETGGLDRLGPEGYLIRYVAFEEKEAVVMVGSSGLALAYAVFHFMRSVLKVDFFFDGERLPAAKPTRLQVKDLDVVERPKASIRYWKPELHGDVSPIHSPWLWRWPRWRQAIHWCVQNRLNGIELTLFAHMNWIQDPGIARVKDDPLFSTQARTALIHRIIAEAHRWGLKALLGLCTAGARLEYAGTHPEAAARNTPYGSIYQGELCWERGKDYLFALLTQYMDTFPEADGTIFQPDECGCRCKACVTGAPFLRLFRRVYARSRRAQRNPPSPKATARHSKMMGLWDWLMPAASVPAGLPKDVVIVNVHEFQRLPQYLKNGLPFIYQPAINWNGASFTTISPFPRLLKKEMTNALDAGALGFEGHHVSMFSGEFNAQAFAQCAWDPGAFEPKAFTRDYVAKVYGEPVSDYARVFETLEKLWTPPLSNYVSLLLDVYGTDYADEAFPKKIGNEFFRSVLHQSAQYGVRRFLTKVYDPITVDEYLARLARLLSRLRRAARILQRQRLRSEPQLFLQASVGAQLQFALWCRGRYRSFDCVHRARRCAKSRSWNESRLLLERARTHLRSGEAALRALGKIVFGNPRWFATRPCLAGRDIDPMISTQGVRYRWQRYYTSLLLYPPFEPLASAQVLHQQLDRAFTRVARRKSDF